MIFLGLEDKSVFKKGGHTYVKMDNIAMRTNQIYNSLNLDTGHLEHISADSVVTEINGKFVEE